MSLKLENENPRSDQQNSKSKTRFDQQNKLSLESCVVEIIPLQPACQCKFINPRVDSCGRSLVPLDPGTTETLLVCVFVGRFIM